MKESKRFDYRKYLNDHLKQKKSSKPNFSIGMWAKQLGLKSTASLSKVLTGEREAGRDLTDKLIRYFQMSEQQALSFRNAVAIEKLKVDSHTKEKIITSVLTEKKLKQIQAHTLNVDYSKLLRNPLPLALRELTRVSHFSIQEFVDYFTDYTEKEIKEALQLLLDLDMIRENKNKEYYANVDHVATTDDIPSAVIKDYHKTCLAAAQTKVQNISVEEREFQSMMLLINSVDIPTYKNKIRDFLNTLEHDIHPEKVDQLYQIQLQFYPLSKKIGPFSNPNKEEKD